VFAERAGDRGERFDRDKAVRSGGAPGRAILGEATARDNRVDVGVVLAWPAPGMQDSGEAREVGAEKARVVGPPLEGHGRGLQQRVGRAAWLHAPKGTQGCRDGEGEEEVRPGQLVVQVGVAPWRRFLLLTLGTVAVATGMLDAVLSPTGWALIEAGP